MGEPDNPPMLDLDRIDLRLLKILQEDGRITNLKLAEAVALSPTAVLARVQRLTREGYIEGYEVADDPSRPGKVLTINMKYSPERDRSISGIRRVSKPGLRVYRGADRLPRVLGGLGVAVLSTSHGLMTDREARQRKVGGEVLCYVW